MIDDHDQDTEVEVHGTFKCIFGVSEAVEQSDDRRCVKQMNPETCVQPSKSVGGNDRHRRVIH